mmetsp:Transcript_3806/g.9438  ORF Transcript_3806/g.9438 Transcript_3806/m.9438 type:complete len:383 (+) Transcript_3806:95-1243(+)|eukprot:CAMPEP_0202036542 /NCGR_PEP_ID=MMETSP0962-20130828/1610_1 /ASSEMBLY_ACC=CAM_ASM_000488 /TAXON_ID=4773 /ORGANISM="Schizochytrium aggregatum, Strain ATCC28209" /LENGTH=382 /DNA_ID=CAMNT_0048600621 /DNA_START=82 /DNA_END=1230 /DNA_ORIENTATION=-
MASEALGALIERVAALAAAAAGIVAGPEQPLSDDGGAALATTRKDFTTFRKLLHETSEQIETEANKLALGWRSMSNIEQAKSLLDAFEGKLESVTTFGFLVCSNPTLCCSAARVECGQALSNLLASVLNLLEFLKREDVNQVDYSAQVPPMVGSIWEACKKVRLVAKTNRMAVKRAVLQDVLTIKDTHTEFTQMLKDQTAEGTGQGRGPESSVAPGATVPDAEPEVGSEEWYAMMDDLGQDDDLEDDEFAVIEAALSFLSLGGRILQLAAMQVGNVEDLTAVTDSPIDVALRRSYVVWLDTMVERSSAVKKSVAAFGMTLYPPVDPVVTGDRAQGVVGSVKELADSLRERSADIPGEAIAALEALEAQLSAALEDLGSFGVM